MTVGAQQRKTVDFGVKSHFAWKSLLQSFFLFENCQRQGIHRPN